MIKRKIRSRLVLASAVRLTTLTGIAVIGATVALLRAKLVDAQAKRSTAIFTSDGKMQLPTGYRAWVFVGAPLTPNALNNGKANFPEYHHVYVEKENVDEYLKTGSFPEGTVFVKELTLVLNSTFPDGFRTEPSGRGFLNSAYNGIDVTVKDSKKFAKTNGWGFSPSGIIHCRMTRPLRKSLRANVRDTISPMLPKLI